MRCARGCDVIRDKIDGGCLRFWVLVAAFWGCWWLELWQPPRLPGQDLCESKGSVLIMVLGWAFWNSIDRNFRVCLDALCTSTNGIVHPAYWRLFHSDKCCVSPATEFTRRACLWLASDPSPAPNNQQPSRSVHMPTSPAPVKVQISDRSAIVKGGLLGASLKAGTPRIS